ncbi:putative ABC-type xenobiotic transporter [Helianthus annuus]|nr:putative ABC-type xenobiotic transporter [Helianthus annuus]
MHLDRFMQTLDLVRPDPELFSYTCFDLQVRYRPNTPLVLKGISLNIQGGQKIGVVGRTDGGKSTLIQVLFRLVEPTGGSIIIDVVDNGDNWSIGQRQLLCLGRVLLKQSRLLFMDEAMASVDSQTDAGIRKIIREDFADSTIISIAHRIPTVMDCDRVLVIDAGNFLFIGGHYGLDR